MVERIPMGRMGDAGGGRRAHLLARERGVLVLDGRDVRHLGRAGGVLAAAGSAARAERRRATERSRTASVRTRDGVLIELLDPDA